MDTLAFPALNYIIPLFLRTANYQMLLILSIHQPTITEKKNLKAHLCFFSWLTCERRMGDVEGCGINAFDFTPFLLFALQRARVIVSWSEKKRFSIFIPWKKFSEAVFQKQEERRGLTKCEEKDTCSAICSRVLSPGCSAAEEAAAPFSKS